jgi:sensor c-di-GMP phosphodiesterase-like protein
MCRYLAVDSIFGVVGTIFGKAQVKDRTIRVSCWQRKQRHISLAMYQAKALGKACGQVYDQSMHVSALKRLALESNLRRALENNEFVLHYQPIVSLGGLSLHKLFAFSARQR